MPSDTRILHDTARILPRSPTGEDSLVRRLASASTVLIGEANHGTHEFYDLRAELTRRLVEDHVLHGVGIGRFWLDLHDRDVRAALDDPRLERAIGVVHRPETERVSHYFGARLPDQFDVVCHIDQTTALEPLDDVSAWDEGAVADTYPGAV